MALTAVGLCLIVEQTITGAIADRIQTQILVTGLVLTGGSVAVHVGKFVTAQLSGHSSPPESLPVESASASPRSPRGGTDE